MDITQFEAALTAASAEWPDYWFRNTPSDDRVVSDADHTSKAVPLSLTPNKDELEHTFRALFNAINKDVRDGVLPMSEHNRIALKMPVPTDAKPATCYLTSKDVWGNGTWQFTLRDARTNIGFDVFTGPDGRVIVTSAWVA